MRHNTREGAMYKQRETMFSDLTLEDFARTRLRYSPHKRGSNEAMLGRDDDVSSLSMNEAELKDVAALKESETTFMSIPKFSWRQPPAGYGNVVGKVHDQENMCASCWAFVTADSIASRIAVITKDDAPELSVKQLMACDTVDHACSTGNMYTAYEWLSKTGGISTRGDYDRIVPGQREDDPDASCAANVKKKYTTPAMCDLKQTAGESALMNALFNRGPVAVGINANLLMQYSNGVIMASDCPPLGEGIYSINHAALVVGWGVDDHGIKYWELKNSYGEDWGDDGFFRLQRGVINDRLFGTCGLLFESVYPIVVEPGKPASTDVGCTPGSVKKETYYREEADNPGSAMGEGNDVVKTGEESAQRSGLASFKMSSSHLGAAARDGERVSFAPVVAAFALFAVVAVVSFRAASRSSDEEREVLLYV